MKSLYTSLLFSFLLFQTGLTQSTFNSSGGNGSSPEGSVSYSIGSFTGSGASISGSANSSPQIPAEFFQGDAPLGNYPTPPGSGEALSFDGGNDYVNIDPVRNLMAGAEADFSLEAWFKIPNSSLGDSDVLHAINKSNGSNVVHTKIRGDGVIAVFDDIGGDVIVGQNVGDNKWHHVAFTRQGSTGSLFLDGVLQGTYTANFILSANDLWALGQEYDGGPSPSNFLLGQMDEVRIWNSALSESEIRDHMCQKDLSAHPQIANLAAYYRFDDGSGSTVLQDISGNGNNGTLTNMDPATDWVTSGAPIGDQSAQGYGTASVSLSDGTSMTVDNLTGTPDGVHVYRVNEAPNDVSLPGNYTGFESSEYYGVHTVGGSSPTYDLTWDYSSNANIDGFGNEDEARLASRENNAAGAFSDVFIQALDESANTLSLQNQSGTEYIAGFAPSPSYPTPPGSGLALEFQGQNERAQLGVDFFSTPSSISVEFWINSSVQVGNPMVFSIEGSYFSRIYPNGNLIFSFDASTPGSQFIDAGLNDGLWHHIAGMNNGSETFVYVDGVYAGGQMESIVDIDLLGRSGSIGGQISDSGVFIESGFSGLIDEFRIWSTSLSEQEIRDHMCQKDLSAHPQIANLAAYYRFDDGIGSTVLQDISGNGNDGVLTNMDPASDWVTSGAPIGDQSTQGYGTSSVSLADGTSMTVDNLTGSPDGVHVYRVNEAPNDVTVPASYSALETSEYYGVHLVGGTNPSYSATFDYTGNTNIDGQANESAALLASRSNNAGGAFENIAAQTLDASANTIIAPNQTGTEYIPGFNQIVDTDGDGVPDATDPCPINANAFLDDCGTCVGGDTGLDPCASADLVLTASDATPTQCDEFTVLVSVESADTYNTVEALLNFDPNELQVVEVTAPDGSNVLTSNPPFDSPNGLPEIDNINGSLTFVAGATTDITGDIDFIRISFEVIGNGGTTSITPVSSGLPRSRVVSSGFVNGVADAIDILNDALPIDISLSPDLEDPTFDCVGNVSPNADAGVCTYTVQGAEYDPTNILDNCGILSVENDINNTASLAGEVLTDGTMVTWTVTDENNNSDQCSFTVTVNDVDDPVVSCPADITMNNDQGLCSAVVSFNATATDNCNNATVTYSQNPGTAFPVGTTTVTATATDAAGNTATCNFDITITDNEDPTISAPADVSVSADAAMCSASGVTLGSASASDNCPGVAVSDDAPAIFPVGTTVVTFTATDAAGNTATATQSVTVTDDEDPTISAPADVSASADAAMCSASSVALGSASASDNCPGVAISDDAPATFPVGTTVVTYTATDAAGNTATATQSVTVTDDEDPTISAPADVSVSADAAMCSASGVMLGSASASDNCPGVAISDDAPATFPVGTTVVTYTATDAAGNTATATQSVTVTDDENPTISAPSDVTVSADAAICSASGVTLGSASASDNCPGVAISDDAPATFPVGTTVVTYTVTDAAGNMATATQSVTVTDDEDPITPSLADVMAECSATLTAPTTTDNCAGTITGTTSDPLTYSSQGTFTVTWNFDDGNGNNIDVDQTVIIDDMTAPVADAVSLADVTAECEVASITPPTATDNCEGTITGTTTTVFPIATQGTTTVTWTFDDGNGNASTQIQDVVINDVTAPVAPTLADVTAECSATLTAPTTTDNCAGTITGTTSDPLTYSSQGTFTVTWNFDDGNGNNIDVDQTVIIDDMTAPVPDVPTLLDVTAECEVTSLTDPTAADNCGGTVSVTNNATLPITAQGTTVVVWSYDDGNGNVSTQNQNVVIDDVTAPVITCAANVTVDNDPGQCSADVTITPPSVSDNCTAPSASALDFDGSNDLVSIPNFPFQLDFTLEAWVNPILLAQEGYKSVISRGAVFDNNTNYAFGFRYRPQSADYRIYLSFRNGAAIQLIDAVIDNPSGIWNHMAVSFDSATKEVALYWNGALINSSTFTINPGDGNQNLTLGNPASADGQDDPYNGQIDEVRIWNRALSSLEIASSYNVLLQGSELGLLAYYNFEDGIGSSTLTDVSPNGNDGTLLNMDPSNDWVPSSAPISAITLTNNITGTADASGTYPVGDTDIIWTATDAAGNTSTCEQTVTVIDNELPTISAPADVSVSADADECSASGVVLGSAAASDNCPGVAVTDDAPVTFPVGTTEVTYTATDASGNTNTATQSVTVTDDELPTISAPANVSVSADADECSASGVVLGSAAASDNCTGVAVTDDAPVTFPVGTTEVTYTATDASGNTNTATQSVTVTDDELPTISAPANVSVSADADECSASGVVLGSAAASDNCTGVAVTDDAPATFPVGTTEVTYTATDASGNTNTATQSVTVTDDEDPITPSLADITAECSATLTAPTTTDNCAGTVTGTTADPLTYSSQGTFTVTWNFDDGNGNNIDVVQTVIIDDMTAPAADAASLADVTAECEVTSITPPTATDICEGAITGTTTTVFPIATQGTTTVTWTFDDGNGNASTQIQDVVINDVTAPVVPTLADVTAECSATLTAPTTTDNCAGAITGTTSDPLIYSSQGTFTVTWNFDDGNGNNINVDQTVIIDDVTAPVADAVSLADVTAECEVASITPPTATDNCEGTITGTTTTVFPIATQGTTTVTWTFDDGNGNASTQTQDVVINDVTAPVAPTLADVTAECSATLTAPTTTDNCAGTITGTTSDPLTYSSQGTFTVTWNFDDGNGNSIDVDQTVIIDDMTAPTINAPTDVSVSADIDECSASSVSLGSASANDNCSGVIVTDDAPATFPVGTTTVTYTATDVGGNTATATQTVTVTDDQLPEISCAGPATVTINQTNNTYLASGGEFDPTSVSDNCPGVTVSHDASLQPGTSGTDTESLDGWEFPVGTTTITFTAIDAAGNTTDCEVIVTVENAIVTGTLVLNTLCLERDMKVTIYETGTAILAGTFNGVLIDSNGDFSFDATGITPGNYDVYLKPEDYLTKMVEDVTIGSTPATITATAFAPGDIDAAEDDQINGNDLSLIIGAYNTEDGIDAAYNSEADINCDGFVDALDLSLLIFFFFDAGESPN